MTKQDFLSMVKENVVVLDGATGTNLFLRGMPKGVCPEKWISENPEVMIGLQREYVENGSNIVYAPTFSGNRIKLAEYGLEEEIKELNLNLVEISRKAVDGKALVAGNLTMTGEQLEPVGQFKFEELVDVYKEQVSYLVEAKVDLFVIETMMNLQETRAALLAVKETTDLPVMVTMTFQEDGRTLSGTDAVTAIVVLQGLGADAVGVNCSTGPDQMCEVVKTMKEYATVPLIAKPNAGLPQKTSDGNIAYDMNAVDFGQWSQKLVEAGANIVGGCCGTTPSYIKEVKEQVRSLTPPAISDKKRKVLTSDRKFTEIVNGERFLLIGERINPTGKKALQEELRNNRFEIVSKFANEQELDGADFLDINVGMNGVIEKDTFLKVMEKVLMVSHLPLVIDSSDFDTIEAALRNYPGRALLNSISLEKNKCEHLLPLAKKYGAMFILLPLSSSGLPKNLEEKIENINTILEKAQEIGLSKDDIVVDGLVTTIGANKKAALETMETIRYCNEKGISTVCGLSNISFGLPEREFINSTFLTLAIGSGLTMAIADPSKELLVKSFSAADLLMGKSNADLNYIDTVQRFHKDAEAVEVKKIDKTPQEIVYDDVLKGSKKIIVEHVKNCLELKMLPIEIVNTILVPAINEVGEFFNQKKYFLPQLILSANAMKTAVDYLEPMMEEDNKKDRVPVVVIATVEGDIHDFGKNLVALMLKNYGFKIIDLGKDVPKEKIVQVAIEENADIIALSALMTTTMHEMGKVVELVKEKSCSAKVIIGGAVITPSYAEEIHADGYSKDAAEAVKLVQNLLGVV